ncbi:MAG: hypothetical protein HFJ28_02875 [Clostridia bacterium]|nr:hypothetical protein [Clostridia bacterium]
MKTKKFLTQILSITVFTILLMGIQTTTSKAVLQANKNTHYNESKGKQNIGGWLLAFRNMETSRRSNGAKRDN